MVRREGLSFGFDVCSLAIYRNPTNQIIDISTCASCDLSFFVLLHL